MAHSDEEIREAQRILREAGMVAVPAEQLAELMRQRDQKDVSVTPGRAQPGTDAAIAVPCGFANRFNEPSPFVSETGSEEISPPKRPDIPTPPRKP